MGSTYGIIRPRALRRGDRIAIVAPSGVVDPGRLEEGVRILERRGYEVERPPRRDPERCFAASDAERRADLLAAFADPQVRAVWCARGGYGLTRILPGLDVEWLRGHAKLCVGFSDATALLQRLVSGAGVAAVHGPMVASDLPRESATRSFDHLLGIVSGESKWRVPVARGLVAGEVSAPLLGGCLTVLASLSGTPYATRFAGAIALIEDIGERPQRRIDRMLVQLRQSGALAGVRGIVFGTMPDCGEPDELCRTLVDCLADLAVPIGFGAPLGHGDANFAVPLGAKVRLCVDRCGSGLGEPEGSLDGLEPAVS